MSRPLKIILAIFILYSSFFILNSPVSAATETSLNQLASDIDLWLSKPDVEAYIVWQYSGSSTNYWDNDQYSFYRHEDDKDNNVCALLQEKSAQYSSKSIGVNIWAFGTGGKDSDTVKDTLNYLSESCGVKALRVFGTPDLGGTTGIRKIISNKPDNMKLVVALANFYRGSDSILPGSILSNPTSWYGGGYTASGYLKYAEDVAKIPGIYAIELGNEPHCANKADCVGTYTTWATDVSMAIKAAANSVGNANLKISIGQAASSNTTRGDSPTPSDGNQDYKKSNFAPNTAINFYSGHHYGDTENQINLEAYNLTPHQSARPFYIGEAGFMFGETPAGRAKPIEPFESSIEQDPIFVHKFDLEELRGQYVPTYAESPDTHAQFGGPTEYCGTWRNLFIDCSDVLQEVRRDLLPKRLPWLGSESAAATGALSDRYLSVATQYGYKAPRGAKAVLSAPINKLTPSPQQFRDIMQYLRSIVRKCASLNTEEERRRCALPRTVNVGNEEMTEITFYFRYLSSLTSADQLTNLPEEVQQVFKQIVSQVQEGKEFKIALWFNYLDDPQDAELTNPQTGANATPTTPQGAVDILHFGSRKVDIKWVPFLVPVTAGTEADPTIPDSADATPKKTRKPLLSARYQQKLEVDWQNRIASRYDALQEPEFATGPCIPCDQDEQCRRDELVHSMAMIINASFYNDCEQLPYGEQANTATIDTRMGLSGLSGTTNSIAAFFQAVSNIFLSFGSDIIHGLTSSGDEAFLQVAVDPTKEGELTIVSRSWILAPPETLKLNITGQEELAAFTPAYLKNRLSADNNDSFTDYYQMHNGTTTAVNPTKEIRLQDFIQDLLEDLKITLHLATAENTPGEETVRGLVNGQQAVGFQKYISNATQTSNSQYSFNNSTDENGTPCKDNLDEADCFYWENGAFENSTTTIERPAPQTPPTSTPTSTEALVCAPHPRPDGGDGAPDVHEGEDGVFGAPPLNKIIRDAAAKYGIKPCVLAGIAMVEAPHIFHEEGPNGYTTAKVNALAAPGAVDEMNCHPNSCTAAGPMQMLTGFCGNPQTCGQNYKDPNDPNKYTGGHSWEEFQNAGDRCPNCNVCNLYDSIYAAAAFLKARAGSNPTPTNAVKAYFGECSDPLPGYLGGNHNYCSFAEAFCTNSH